MVSETVPDLVPAQVLSVSERVFSRYPYFIEQPKNINIGVIRVSEIPLDVST